MNLHVFNDPHGFILNLAIERLITAADDAEQLFINLTDQTVYKHERVRYIKRNARDFRRAIDKLPHIDNVLFYPLDFTAAIFLKEFKRKQKELSVSWIFWSYEYYHRPDIYLSNLEGYSLHYYRRNRSLSKVFNEGLRRVAKRVLSIPVFDAALLNVAYHDVTRFYSFLPRDFKHVHASVPGNKFSYHPISFLSIDEITKGMNRDRSRRSKRIMLGHSASISNNHYEMIERVSRIDIDYPIFLPLEYGDLEYGRLIQKRAESVFIGRVTFLESRLSMTEYYSLLAEMGFAVFNFRRQEALGNILFLIWNGAKVFLRDTSSVYQQFQQWGITVFSLETELNEANLLVLLDEETAMENRRLLEGLFSEAAVQQYWRSLLDTRPVK